jgi:hypothetical protein
MLIARRTGKGVTFWKNFPVSRFLFSNDDLADGGPTVVFDYGDYAGCAFQSGKFFSPWADNSNSTNDNPSESNPNPPPTHYNPLYIFEARFDWMSMTRDKSTHPHPNQSPC